MTSALARNIQDVLRERSLSPYAASIGAGLGGSYVRDIVRGKTRNPKTEHLQQLADFLDVRIDRLTGGAVAPTRYRPARDAGLLPIRHVVQAGAWIEEDEQPQVPRFGPPIAVDPAYQAAQWLEEVRGDSMDVVAPEGALVHVADWADLGVEPRTDQIVVVQRTRAGGQLRERSLKSIRRDGDRIELWPQSSNRRWGGPLVLVEDGDDAAEVTVSLVGLVIAVYRPLG